MGKRSVERWETGAVDPSAEQLVALVKTLGPGLLPDLIGEQLRQILSELRDIRRGLSAFQQAEDDRWLAFAQDRVAVEGDVGVENLREQLKILGHADVHGSDVAEKRSRRRTNG